MGSSVRIMPLGDSIIVGFSDEGNGGVGSQYGGIPDHNHEWQDD